MNLFEKSLVRFAPKLIENIAKPNKRKDIRKKISAHEHTYRIRQDIGIWRDAVNSAESITNPQRTELLRTYKDVILDSHLTAAITQRKKLTLAKKFEISIDGVDNKELTKLVKTAWFRDFLDLSLDSIFYGHSLIQFGDVTDTGFESVDLVPREFVKPESHLVTQNRFDSEGGRLLKIPLQRMDYSCW